MIERGPHPDKLLDVSGLVKHFPVFRGVFAKEVGRVRAVDDVSFDIAKGETLGLVGESGCGKTTAGRCILRLEEPTSGRILFDGKDVLRESAAALRSLRRDMQIIFQDPFSSLNPRMRIVDIIGESLEVHRICRGAETERRVADLMRRVGLSPGWINRYPHEFSGGQRQRVGIARALALDPKLIVCDEAVSALDVSIQAQVLNLLSELRHERRLSYLFIAHDLSVVRHLCHRVAVMYLGEIVEIATARELFHSAAHPYTRALLSAIPVPQPGRHRHRIVLAGDVPSPADPPPGCRFHTRCPAVMDRCRSEAPPGYVLSEGHSVRCFHAEGLEGDADWAPRVAERIERHSAANSSGSGALVSAERLASLRSAATPPREAAPSATEAAGARRAIGLATCAFGALLVALGEWPLGLPLAMAAYFGAARPRGASRRRIDRTFAAVLLLALMGSGAVRSVARERRARAELASLQRELEAYREVTGKLPGRLRELSWRLYPILKGGALVDPWGGPWLYREPGTEGRDFDLGSLGADGVRSDDDVGHPPDER